MTKGHIWCKWELSICLMRGNFVNVPFHVALVGQRCLWLANFEEVGPNPILLLTFIHCSEIPCPLLARTLLYNDIIQIKLVHYTHSLQLILRKYIKCIKLIVHMRFWVANYNQKPHVNNKNDLFEYFSPWIATKGCNGHAYWWHMQWPKKKTSYQ